MSRTRRILQILMVHIFLCPSTVQPEPTRGATYSVRKDGKPSKTPADPTISSELLDRSLIDHYDTGESMDQGIGRVIHVVKPPQE